MNFLYKSIGFLAVMATLPAGFALTSRVSMTSMVPVTRMPSIAGSLLTTSPTYVTSTSTATDIEEEDAACSENYIQCLKGGDVCGSDFEECTNKTLLFAKQGMCASTLSQCSSTVINKLYGTTATTAFATKVSTATDADYTYPLSTSVLGQMVEAGYLNNRYDTSTCVRRYESCLKRSDVCGSDFELCTGNTEFKTQKIFCESTLARCQEDGIKELFGTTSPSNSPAASSRLGVAIEEGAALAAINAVSTCYKVADQCIVNACASNPYKCKEGSNVTISNAADAVSNTSIVAKSVDDYSFETINGSAVRGYISDKCFDTISSNKYCYATFVGNGAMPTNSQLRDEDNKYDIFEEAYATRMSDSMESKIEDLITEFDETTKERCIDTITDCAMNSCGGGIGSACYALSYDPSAKSGDVGVNSSRTYSDIYNGCSAIVNNDNYCKYAGATFNMTTGVLDFEDDLFSKLFPSADSSAKDEIGVIGLLNARLSTSYNDAALAQMKSQCESVATGCIRTECGTDFENCYRNRNDIFSSLTATNSESFNDSMNRVGGVLDYTVALGLCLDTVKKNSTCNEHLQTESARINASLMADDYSSAWGTGANKASTVRDGWLSAGQYGVDETVNIIQATNALGEELCTNPETGAVGNCSGLFTEPYMVSFMDYAITEAGENLFSELIFDLEKEAQAQYNAKLTKQQNMCMSGNTGITGAKNVGGTFMWSKLRSNKLPKDYSLKGLGSNDFVASNEIYDSFCRIRVTVLSDDKMIQDSLGGDSIGYFAAGDSFTCGSWIDQDVLDNITEQIEESYADQYAKNKKTAGWVSLGTTVAGLIGGGFGGNAVQDLIEGKTGNKNDLAKATSELQRATTEKTNACADTNSTSDDCKAATAVLGVAQKNFDAANNSSDTTESKDLTNWIGIGAGAAVTGTAGGIIGYQATKQSLDAKVDAEKAAAIQEWMDEIGSKIKCYIGPDEVGSYGDMISTEF